MCALVEDACESHFDLLFHSLTLFYDLMYFLKKICMCDFRELWLESQAAQYRDGVRWDVVVLDQQG